MAFEIRSADYTADFAAIRFIRFSVFVDEQHVPEEIELDERDPVCRHFLAVDGGAAVGTARIDLPLGKIGRLSVLGPSRRRGIGRALMEACHDSAATNGVQTVWCNAQVTAVPFYERLGYSVTGEAFLEAGIEHVRMTKALE